MIASPAIVSRLKNYEFLFILIFEARWRFTLWLCPGVMDNILKMKWSLPQQSGEYLNCQLQNINCGHWWPSVEKNSIIREAVYPGDSKKHYKANLKPIISSLDMAQKWAQMTLIVSHNDSFVTLSQLSGGLGWAGLAAGHQSTLSSLSAMSTQSPTVHCRCTTAANTLVCHTLWPLATWTLTFSHLNFPTAAPYGGQWPVLCSLCSSVSMCAL